MAKNRVVFGTDGFRGVISDDFTYDTVKKIAQGFSDFIVHKHIKIADRPDIVIGYDRRFMSRDFAKTFAGIVRGNNLNVLISDTPVSTPAISYATYKKNAAGIMITASHNKYMYNGVKIKEGGKSASPTETAAIEGYIAKASPVASSDDFKEYPFKKKYIAHIKSKFNPVKIFAKLKSPVIIDFMRGSGAEYVQELFSSSKVISINCESDPLFGQIPPEPIEKNLVELSNAVKKREAAFGIALDGDADRFAMVNEKGEYLSPHQIAPILLEYLLSKHKIKGKLIQAVSMGYLTRRVAEEKGILVEEVPVGFKYIAEKMVSEEVAFGVEESGGYSWKGNMPERDGIVTGLLMAQIVAEKKKSVSQIYADIEKKYGKSCFLRKDFHLSKTIKNKHSFAVKCRKKMPKTLFSKKVKSNKTIDGLKIMLENDEWILIRPSGTEPLLRIYAETASWKDTQNLVDFAFNAALKVK